MKKEKYSGLQLGIMIALCLSVLLKPVTVKAVILEEQKLVRIGYFDYAWFIHEGENHSYTGYGVEYLNEIAKYTGWQCEFVPLDWNDAFRQLETGEIDLIGIIHYSENRAKKYLYSQYACGEMPCILYVKPENENYYFKEYTAFDGIEIGMIRNSRLTELLKEEAKKEGFWYKERGYNSEKDAFFALDRGDIDAVLTTDESYQKDYKVIDRFTPQPFYWVTAKKNTILMEGLNNAVQKIQEERSGFVEELTAKYISKNMAGAIPNFNRKEADYIKEKQIVRVGVRERNPWMYIEKETGKQTGISIEILKKFEECSGLKLEPILIEDTMNIKQVIKKEKLDLLMDVVDTCDVSSSFAAQTSSPYYEDNLTLAVKNNFSKTIKDEMTIAIPQNFMSGKQFLKDYFPQFQIVEKYTNLAQCLKAVQKGEVDGAIEGALTMNAEIQKPFYDELVLNQDFAATERFCVCITAKEQLTLLSIMNKIITVEKAESINQIVDLYVSGNSYQYTNFELLYRYRYDFLFFLFLIFFGIYMNCQIQIQKKKNTELLYKKNKELEKVAKKAQEASKAKGEFLSRMSHEIRTPLNAITGFAALSLKNMDDSEKIEDYLKKISTSSDMLLQIVNDVLDVSAIESRKMKLLIEPFSMKEFLQKLESVYQIQCAQKGIQFSMENLLPDEITFCGDGFRVNQILLNLLSNATKFTNEGGTIRFRTEMCEQDTTTARIRFTISDTGIGIANTSKLFESFEQEDGSIARKYGGSGLGLSITKSLVEMMEGIIQVESEKGKGTTFFVELTFPYTLDKKTLENRQTIPDLRGKRILLVEDNELNGEITTELLQETGAEVHWVKAGQEAVEIFKKQRENEYWLVFMDIHMPNMNGYETARAIRELKTSASTRVFIIALTADAFYEDVQKAKEAGMNGHLSKPIDIDALYQLLDSYC